MRGILLDSLFLYRNTVGIIKIVIETQYYVDYNGSIKNQRKGANDAVFFFGYSRIR